MPKRRRGIKRIFSASSTLVASSATPARSRIATSARSRAATLARARAVSSTTTSSSPIVVVSSDDDSDATWVTDFDYTGDFDYIFHTRADEPLDSNIDVLAEPAYEPSDHLFIKGMQNIISSRSDLGAPALNHPKGSLNKTWSAGYTKFVTRTLNKGFLPDGTRKSEATHLDYSAAGLDGFSCGVVS